MEESAPISRAELLADAGNGEPATSPAQPAGTVGPPAGARSVVAATAAALRAQLDGAIVVAAIGERNATASPALLVALVAVLEAARTQCDTLVLMTDAISQSLITRPPTAPATPKTFGSPKT